MTNFLASDKVFANYFFNDNYFLLTINFFGQIFLPAFFFHKKDHLVFSNLKIPLVYLFHFKFD